MKGTGFDLSRWPSAGRVLAVGSAVPALALAGWLLTALPLLLLGWFHPVPALVIGLPIIAALCWYGLRRLPSLIEATGRHTAAVAGIALASGVFNGVFHAEQLIVRRDPATYAQYAAWLAEHGSLPIPFQEAAFGGPDPSLVFDSVGFYEFQGAVVPQFMPGPPLILAVGHWLGGVPGLLLTPPVLGALAVLTFSGVAARLIGPRWAPLAALTMAVSLPILYTSRTTFSEIPSLILIFGAVSLLLDARERLRTSATGGGQGGGARGTAALAGLVFGLATLVRIDGLRDVLPVLAYAGLLIALHRLARASAVAGARDGVLGLPLLAGVTAGIGVGFAAAQLVAWPYLDYLRGSLVPLLLICAAVLLLTAVGAMLAPRLAQRLAQRLDPRSTPRPGRVRLPEMAALGVVLVMLAFAVRPFLQTVRRTPTTPEDRLTSTFIATIQRANGLPLDGERLYYEDSLSWVMWYVGVPVVLLATLAAAVLARRLAKGTSLVWLLPLAIVGWTTVTTLILPAITPDHPFAARRLVPVIIPGMVLLGVWGLRWVRDKARRMGYGLRVRRMVVAVGGLLVLVPPAVISIGTAFTPVGHGEAAAVSRLCAAIPPDASVLVVERVTGDRFTQLVRGMCGVPAAQVRLLREGDDLPPSADVTRLIDRTRAAGRRPVLLAAARSQLTPYVRDPRQIMTLRTRQDERSLTTPPNATWSLSIDVWLGIP
ncbi:hypothetical protein [Streptosporangium sp. KLBMP 9127]|nr:hypothetical protein [Streptosporangium sp. KLBMP 9127]